VGAGVVKSMLPIIATNKLSILQAIKIIIKPGKIIKKIAMLNKIDALNHLKIKSKDENNIPVLLGWLLLINTNILTNPKDSPTRNNSEEI